MPLGKGKNILAVQAGDGQNLDLDVSLFFKLQQPAVKLLPRGRVNHPGPVDHPITIVGNRQLIGRGPGIG